MTAPEPTAQDLHNAAIRQAVADRQNAEYAEALQLAEQALGPGWQPWMKLSLIDSDHRQTGNTEPVATAYKVYRGEERLTENSVYLRLMPDGSVQQAANFEELFGEVLHEKHPTRGIQYKGQWCAAPRWELCWSALDVYQPRSAADLAAARVKREERVVEKFAEANPLFAEQIREEGIKPETRKKTR